MKYQNRKPKKTELISTTNLELKKMKTKKLNWAAMALVPAAILTFTSCSSTPKGGTESSAMFQEGKPGGIVVDTYRETATVTGIDPATRKITLVTPDGQKNTITAGPEVRNFDQIRIGDQVRARVTRETAVRLLPPGETRGTSETGTIALAPKGAKPGAIMANTIESTARIEALDMKHRKVTLRFQDGQTKTFDVRKDVDMTNARLGQEVLIQYTESVAISVEKV